MHIPLLVISQRILLQTFLHNLISNDNSVTSCYFYDEFKDIEKFPGISTAIP